MMKALEGIAAIQMLLPYPLERGRPQDIDTLRRMIIFVLLELPELCQLCEILSVAFIF